MWAKARDIFYEIIVSSSIEARIEITIISIVFSLSSHESFKTIVAKGGHQVAARRSIETEIGIASVWLILVARSPVATSTVTGV